MCCRCGWRTTSRPSWTRSARAASWSGSAPAVPTHGGGGCAFCFGVRATSTWSRRPTDLAAFGEAAQAVYAFLKSEGAVFFADIRSALELETAAAEAALIELVMAGLVTNDSLEAMRSIVERGAPATSRAEAVQRAGRGVGQACERLGLRTQPATARPSGRSPRAGTRRPNAACASGWSSAEDHGALGGPLDAGAPFRGLWVRRCPLAERVAQQARQLLARYGVVTHERLADEIGAWDWSLISQQLQRLEMRGEVRRGYFVQGLPGASVRPARRGRAAADASGQRRRQTGAGGHERLRPGQPRTARPARCP